MKAQADGDDGREFDQGSEEQVPIIELMKACFLHGAREQDDIVAERMTGPLGAVLNPDTWARWWQDHGGALLDGYYSLGRVAHEEPEVLANIHTVVAANNAMLTIMIDAMQEMEPDDTVDEEGEVWTLTAETPDGISLVRTVRCLTMTTAIATATKAWGHGLWESLRKRRAVSDG